MTCNTTVLASGVLVTCYASEIRTHQAHQSCVQKKKGEGIGMFARRVHIYSPLQTSEDAKHHHCTIRNVFEVKLKRTGKRFGEERCADFRCCRRRGLNSCQPRKEDFRNVAPRPRIPACPFYTGVDSVTVITNGSSSGVDQNDPLFRIQIFYTEKEE